MGICPGTTPALGPGGGGTVFKMSLDGTVTILQAFTGVNGDEALARGAYPGGRREFLRDHVRRRQLRSRRLRSLVRDRLRMTPAGTTTILHAFVGTDGSGPRGLIQATDGNFFGTAGNVFEMAGRW